MNEFVRSLSARAEFCIVVVVAFGYIMLGNVLSVFYPAREPAITNESPQSLVVFEAVIFLMLGPLLYERGWRLSRLAGRARSRSVRRRRFMAVPRRMT